jgi:hypothetical protein
MRSLLAATGVLFAVTAWADDKPRDVRGETIIVRGHAPGYRQAEPVKDQHIAPAYSGEAIEKDAWTRAWMIVEIDESGVVQRMKFLKRPGYDLDQIAIDRAFATKFTPARTGDGRAVASSLVIPIEWPSYWWLNTYEGLATRIPEVIGNIPCAGSGNPLNLSRTHPVYRDCSLPDMSRAASEPWIERSGSAGPRSATGGRRGE